MDPELQINRTIRELTAIINNFKKNPSINFKELEKYQTIKEARQLIINYLQLSKEVANVTIF